MDDSGYRSLNDEDNDNKRSCGRTTCFVLASALVTFLITYFVTKHHFEGGGGDGPAPANGYDPTKPFQVPDTFQAEMIFYIPYMPDFKQPVVAMVDKDKGVRLSYYSGTDVYIYNTQVNASNYAWYPVNDKQTCFETAYDPDYPTSDHLPKLFPDLTLFALQPDTENITTAAYPNGVECHKWSFSYGTETKDITGNATAILPNEKGYAGDYSFYVRSTDGVPVRFHMVGHGMVFMGSHTDEYHFDYISLDKLQHSTSDALFRPPSGMECHEGRNPFGPTEGGVTHRSAPHHDFLMLYPEGHDMRSATFQDYAREHNKPYHHPEHPEHKERSTIFHSSLRYINAANRRGLPYVLKANHLADLTSEEITALTGRGPTLTDRGVEKEEGQWDPQTFCGDTTVTNKSFPLNWDWRSKKNGGTQDEPGLVLPPKDQGACGSCWTYGTTGTVEGAVAKATGTLSALSEQSVMDCTWTQYGNAACGGGNDFLAFWWLITQGNEGRMASDDSYGHYLNVNGFCHYDIANNRTTNPWTKKEVEAGARVASCVHTSDAWKNLTHKVITDEESTLALTRALYHIGPLSVSIDAAGSPDFYFYHHGDYYNPNCTWNDLDHTVLAVAYKTNPNGERFTLIRNSWSTHWGENGYAWIAQKDNNCGVATTPLYVTLHD